MTRPTAATARKQLLADSAARKQLLAASVGTMTGIGFSQVGSGDTLIVKSGGDSRDLKRGQRMTVVYCRRVPGATAVTLILADQETDEQLSFEVEAFGALEAEFLELFAPKGGSSVMFRRTGKPMRVPSWADLGECAELAGSRRGARSTAPRSEPTSLPRPLPAPRKPTRP